MTSESQDTIVYLSSIPFDYTEDQIASIAKSVGPITDLKLVFDSTTGRSKGSAFIRYSDREAALSAVRNLNNMNVGNRYLRCTFANDTDAFGSVPDFSSHNKLPPLPLGVQLYQNQTAQQAVSSILTSLDSQTASDLLKDARSMSLENPQLMKKLLVQYPQLSHALVETCLMVNVTTKDLVELCLNRGQANVEIITQDHANLLRSLNMLSEEELMSLEKNKRDIVKNVKNELDKGSYGILD